MPRYDYRCRSCGDVFEVARPLDAPADDAVACPAGHSDAARVWSAVAVGGGAAAPAPAGGGGCCGGGCCG